MDPRNPFDGVSKDIATQSTALQEINSFIETNQAKLQQNENLVCLKRMLTEFVKNSIKPLTATAKLSATSLNSTEKKQVATLTERLFNNLYNCLKVISGINENQFFNHTLEAIEQNPTASKNNIFGQLKKFAEDDYKIQKKNGEDKLPGKRYDEMQKLKELEDERVSLINSVSISKELVTDVEKTLQIKRLERNKLELGAKRQAADQLIHEFEHAITKKKEEIKTTQLYIDLDLSQRISKLENNLTSPPKLYPEDEARMELASSLIKIFEEKALAVTASASPNSEATAIRNAAKTATKRLEGQRGQQINPTNTIKDPTDTMSPSPKNKSG